MLDVVFLQFSFSWFATLFYRTHTVVTSWRKIRDVIFETNMSEKSFFSILTLDRQSIKFYVGNNISSGF